MRASFTTIGISLFIILFLGHCLVLSPPCSGEEAGGRVAGWGFIGTSKRLEPTLPSGWEAENVVRVVAGSSDWAGIKTDGSVIGTMKLPEGTGKVRDIDLCTRWGLIATLEGRVKVFETTDRQLIEPAFELRDVVDVEAGYRSALALRSDGTVVFWGPAYDPMGAPEKKAAVDRLTAFLDRELHDVVEITSKQAECAARRRDGSVVFWRARDSFEHSERWLTEDSIVSVETGSEGGLFGIRKDRTVTFAVDRKNTKLPPGLGSVEWLQTSLGGFAVARTTDGSIRQWGERKYIRFDTDSRLFQTLSRVSFGGSYDSRSGASFVIGIEPSFVSGFTRYSTTLPVLQNLFRDLEEKRLQSQSALKKLEGRYLAELRKLLVSAKKADRGAIAAMIEKELQSFRDRERPAIRVTAVQRLQKIYRDHAPELEEKAHEEMLQVYEEGIAEIRKVEEQLENLGNTGGAAQAALERERMERALNLLRNPPARPVRPAVRPKVTEKLQPVSRADEIFAFDDPRVPGELVLGGMIEGRPIEGPDSGVFRRITAVAAGKDRWYALRPDGEIWAGNADGPVRLSGDLPRLDDIGATGSMWYGFSRRGISLIGKAAEFEPPCDPGEIVSFKARVYPHNHFAALLKDGSVRAWGPNYERRASRWILPEEIADRRDIVEIALANDRVIALTKKRSVVAWGKGGRIEVAPEFDDLIKISARTEVILGLKSDGTVISWDSESVAAVPPGLTQVVDIEAGHEVALALRADGSWIAWGDNPDRVFDRMEDFRGVRWLTTGGAYSESYYIVGIRPDPSDLRR